MNADPTPARTALNWCGVSGHEGVGNATAAPRDGSSSTPVVTTSQLGRSGTESWAAATPLDIAAHATSATQLLMCRKYFSLVELSATLLARRLCRPHRRDRKPR